MGYGQVQEEPAYLSVAQNVWNLGGTGEWRVENDRGGGGGGHQRASGWGWMRQKRRAAPEVSVAVTCGADRCLCSYFHYLFPYCPPKLEDGSIKYVSDWTSEPRTVLYLHWEINAPGLSATSRFPRARCCTMEIQANVAGRMTGIKALKGWARSGRPGGHTHAVSRGRPATERRSKLQSCQTPESRAWMRMWSFCRSASPRHSSSTARRSAGLWRGSWARGLRPSTAPSVRSFQAASCLPKRCVRSAAGLRTTASNLRRRTAHLWRTSVPPISPRTLTSQRRTWSWAGLRKTPGQWREMFQSTPTPPPRGSLLSERSSDGTCNRPAKWVWIHFNTFS